MIRLSDRFPNAYFNTPAQLFMLTIYGLLIQGQSKTNNVPCSHYAKDLRGLVNSLKPALMNFTHLPLWQGFVITRLKRRTIMFLSVSVCVSVCLCICYQHNSRTGASFVLQLSGNNYYLNTLNWLDFSDKYLFYKWINFMLSY